MAAGSDSTSNLRTVLQEKVKGKKFLILGILTAAIVVTISIVISVVCVFVQNGQQKGIYNGRKVYTDGIYIGEFRDGKKEGFGRAEFYNGDVYVGHWKNDTFEGSGRYTIGNRSCPELGPENPKSPCAGNIFVGEWSNSRMECVGNLSLPGVVEATLKMRTVVNISYYDDETGDEYIGAWAKSETVGIVQAKTNNGNTISGEIINRTWVGDTRLVNKVEGFVYTGSLKNGSVTIDSQQIDS